MAPYVYMWTRRSRPFMLGDSFFRVRTVVLVAAPSGALRRRRGFKSSCMVTPRHHLLQRLNKLVPWSSRRPMRWLTLRMECLKKKHPHQVVVFDRSRRVNSVLKFPPRRNVAESAQMQVQHFTSRNIQDSKIHHHISVTRKEKSTDIGC